VKWNSKGKAYKKIRMKREGKKMKNMKLIVNIFIMLSMLMIGSSVFAAGSNFSVGSNTFETLKEAYDSITGASGTIKVEKNCTDSSILTIEKQLQLIRINLI